MRRDQRDLSSGRFTERPKRRVLVALTAVVALVGCSGEPRVAVSPAEIGALVRDLLGGDRPTLGRLSIDLGYRSCTTEGSSNGETVERCHPAPPAGSRRGRAWIRAAGASLGRLGDDRSPAALHAHALWQIVTGGGASGLEHAESLLKDALDQAPEDHALRNDLGVVRLELARRGDFARLVEALDDVARAVSLRPDWPIARFNAALAASAMPLPQVARRSWASLVEAGTLAAPWADEAAARRAAIPDIDLDAAFEARTSRPPSSAADARALVESFPHRAAGYLLETMLPAWSEALSDGRAAEAAARLEAAGHLAAAIAEQQGDRVGAEIVDRIRSDPAALARPIAALGRGRAMLRADDLESATRAFRVITPAHTPDPLFAWARTWLGLIALYGGDHEGAERLLAEAEQHLEPTRHPTILGRVLWHRGLSLARRGRDAESVPTYHRAKALFEELGDRQSAGAMASMIAEDLDALGRTRQAWQMRAEALRNLVLIPRSVRFHNVLLTAAEWSAAHDRTEAGLAFAREAVLEADRGTDAISRTEAAHRLGTLLAGMGRKEKARAAFDRALHDARDIADESFRRRVSADVRLERAELLAARKGFKELGAVLQLFEALAVENRVIDALLARSRVSRQLGDDRAADADLEGALHRLTVKSRTLAETSERLTHAETLQNLFETLIASHADRDRALEALAVAECARLTPYRSFIEAALAQHLEIPCASLIPLLRSFVDRLPESERWLVYFALDERLLVWSLRRGGVQLDTQPIGRSALRRLGAGIADAITDNDRERLRDLSATHWQALGLVAAQGASTIVFVPDGALGRLSFAALIDPASGKHLIETATIEQAVSLMLRHGRERASRSTPADHLAGRRALLVSDPAIDQDRTGLPQLRGARDILGVIEAYFPNRHVLAAREATHDRLLTSLSHADVLYFAGHAVADPREPLGSHLVLAPSGRAGEPDTLTASDLLRQDLGHLDLAVLAACETVNAGTAMRSPSAGLAGLALPFLLRGRTQVVAAMHPVDDAATAQLMRAFFASLDQGLSPSDALRAAQLAMARSPVEERSAIGAWACFTVLR